MKILTFAEYSLNREITQGGAALMRRPLEAMQNRMWLCGAHEWRQKATNLCIGKALTSHFFKCGLLSHNIVDAFSWDQLTRAQSFLRVRNLTCSSCWVLPLLVVSVIIAFLRPSDKPNMS